MAAETMDKAEAFWLLPSEFLPDDIFSVDKTTTTATTTTTHIDQPKPTFLFPSEHDSLSSSPTESDEEEHLAGITRRMAHSFLFDDDQKSSPATAGPDPTWDLLYAAAGQVVRMRREEEEAKLLEQRRNTACRGRGLLGLPRKPSPPAGYFVNPPPPPTITHHQLQINQFYHLKQQQMLKQQQQRNGNVCAWGRQTGLRAGRMTTGGGNGGRSAAWPPPPLPPQNDGSRMRAVFLAGAPAGGRKQSCGGTGVFLPRRVGSPIDSRKKPACSTVLLPTRVIQALNLNLDELGPQPRFSGGFFLDHETVIARKNNGIMSSQKKSPSLNSSGGQLLAGGPAHPEVRLPPEWTY